MAGIDWYADAPAWTHFLRTQSFALSVGDDLRLATLIERLRGESIEIANARDAARWFGPLLCRTADDQVRLPQLLSAWADARAPAKAAAPLPGSLSVVTLQGRRDDAQKSLFAPWRWLVLLPVALVVVLFRFLGPDEITAEPTPRAVSSKPDRLASNDPWPRVSDRVLTGLIVLVPFALVLVVRRHRRREAAAIMRGLVPRDAPTSALRVSLGDFQLFRIQAVRGALADLRRHKLVPADWIDAPRSVAATVAAAGHVKLVQAMRPATPEHLLLVDLAGTDDILATLADLIAARLREGEVRVERFHYHGDPRRLLRIDERGAPQEALDLEALRATCPDHRLLVLSDGTSFSEMNGERMRSWVDQLRAWSDVALVTPVPSAQWGPRERALIRAGLHVVEATPGGVTQLARQFRRDLPHDRGTPGGALPPAFDQWLAADPYRWLGERSPAPGQIDGLVKHMSAVLGPTALLYLEALAVFPTLHPKLTIALGRVLADADGQPVLTESTLALLCRVPWLRRGRLPDWLRLALVRDLRTRPDEEDRVRAAWTTLLEPPKDDADTALPIEVVRSVNPELPQLVSRLIKDKPSTYREAILIAFLNRESLPELAMELPQRLRGMLANPSPWADRALVAFGLITVAIVAAFLGPLSLLLARFQESLQQPIADFLRDDLSPVGWGLGAAALAFWYLGLLIEHWRTHPPLSRVRLPISLFPFGTAFAMPISPMLSNLPPMPRELTTGAAAGCFIAFLVSAAFNDLEPHLFARVLLAAQLLALTAETHDRGALRWVPVLVITQILVMIHVPWTSQSTLLFVDLQILPLIAWISGRHQWPALKQMFWFLAPAAVLKMPLTNTIVLDFNLEFFIMLVLLARFVSDPDFRERVLEPARLSGRELAVLYLPLATALILEVSPRTVLSWDPHALLMLIWFALGITGRSIWNVVLLFFASLLMILLGIGALPWGMTADGTPLRTYSVLMWPGTLTAATAAFMAGRLLRNNSQWEGASTQRNWLLGSLIVLAFALAAVRISISGEGTSSSPILNSFAVLATVATVSLLTASPDLWRWLAAGFVVLVVLATGLPSAEQSRIWGTFGAEPFRMAGFLNLGLAAFLCAGLARRYRHRMVGGALFSKLNTRAGINAALPPRPFVLLDWGRWTWPAIGVTLAALIAAQVIFRKEMTTLPQELAIPPEQFETQRQNIPPPPIQASPQEGVPASAKKAPASAK